jgi:hypothetical protein
MAYLVQLVNDTSEVIDGADAYQQEGPLTTFFRTAPGRAVIDSWSTRLASFRTADIRAIRLDPRISRQCNHLRGGSADVKAHEGHQLVPSGSPST